VSAENEDQQRVLSEVSHDLANRFHRSYYFFELLADSLDPANEGAASLMEKLRATIEELESMTRRALDFMRPMELRTLRVRLSDLTASMRQHAGMREIELRGDDETGACEVEVDPARISEALAFVCKAATDGDESREPLVVELVGGNPVGLRVHCLAGAAEAALTDLPLALTARIARLHGGALEIDNPSGASLTLRLPLAQGGA
jgi:signal transduction histidine kinase